MSKKINVGILYILPWILGILLLKLFPFGLSLFLSFTSYDLMSPPQFIGISNYVEMFKDELFIKALVNTLKYVIITVPLKLAFALFVASLLNFKIKGVGFFRTAYYLPSILGGSVAISVLWRFLFADNGLVNMLLKILHIPTISWMGDQKYALLTIGLLSVWQFGSSMVIFLAALKNIPNTLYEAARIDGASKVRMFFSITFPLLTPVIFFNFIMQMLNAFQEFNAPYIVTKGGPLNSTYLYSLLIYDNSFKYFNMGYASALAWFFFIIIMLCTAIVFKTQKYWVYYEDGGND
ncbi:MAG: sugar ABC transporter permease [Sebaldella sp.]|nr:sugar ABC transporter permease [Sebaldella sp.]